MRKCIIYFLLFFISGSSLFGATTRSEGLKIYQHFERQRFRSDEPVELKIHVKNISGSNASFAIYENPEKRDLPGYTTFQPVVMDMMGRDEEIIVPYILEGRELHDEIVYMEKRIIELSPDEEFVHSIDLKKIYKLQADKKYRVRVYMNPDAAELAPLRSENESVFSISTVKMDRVEKDRIEKIPGVSPSEIISLVLNGEKKKNWDTFTKYINIDRFINSYPNYVRPYNLADRFRKRRIRESFVEFLTRNREDYLLDFEITNELVDKNRGIAYVDVVVDRYGVRLTERYKYRYVLEKYKNLWLVIKLDATVMKGIKR